VGDHATAGGLRAGELERGRGGAVLEQALAIAQDDGVDEQAVLVDQAVLHERPDQCRAPKDLQFAAGLALQLGDLPGHVAPEESRVVPLHPVQGGGHDVFGQGVQPGGRRVAGVGDLRPVLREQFVGLAPQQERAGRGDPVGGEPVHVLVEVRQLPATLGKAVIQLRFGFPVALHDPSSVS
jgi:hypothetical protein